MRNAESDPPKLVLVEEGIELSTKGNLRIRRQLLTQHRLRRSRHIDRGSTSHVLFPFSLNLSLRLRQLEAAARNAARAYLGGLVQVRRIASRSQRHVVVHHLRHQPMIMQRTRR